MIDIDNLGFSHAGSPVLRNVSFRLPKGGLTALVGPNGAGKSTLFALIARLLPLQSGRITIDGLPVHTTPGRDMAKRVAILRQETGLASRLTVEELVGFGRFPHHLGHPRAGDRQIVADVLARFGLDMLAMRRLETLSGGQRQRAFVAMAFAQGTDYLLLDEPLNNLDMFHARRLMQDLRSAVDQEGRSVVVVLHDINHAAAYADHIVILKEGMLLAEGAPRAVLTPAVLETAFGYSMTVREIEGRLTVLHH